MLLSERLTLRQLVFLKELTIIAPPGQEIRVLFTLVVLRQMMSTQWMSYSAA
jgi:hypothetical protein